MPDTPMEDGVERLGDDPNEDIREAYPLMDAVARKEGWDDPEMDSYNVPAEKEEPRDE